MFIIGDIVVMTDEQIGPQYDRIGEVFSLDDNGRIYGARTGTKCHMIGA